MTKMKMNHRIKVAPKRDRETMTMMTMNQLEKLIKGRNMKKMMTTMMKIIKQ